MKTHVRLDQRQQKNFLSECTQLYIYIKLGVLDHVPVHREQGFPSGLLNEGTKDSQCGVKGYWTQGFVVLKRLKLLPNIENSCLLNQKYIKIQFHR